MKVVCDRSVRIGAAAAWLAVAAFVPFTHSTAAAATDVPQPAGYRFQPYDAPVPKALDGATRVTAVDVRELQRSQNALVVDVIPQHRRPAELPDDQLWMPVPHEGLPGALWLPDTGMGALSAVTERYLKRHLRQATDANPGHPLIFYCRTDCWMSWNAAKRALSYGYRHVYWFAEGIDDWFFEGFEFEILEPASGPRQAGDLPDTDSR